MKPLNFSEHPLPWHVGECHETMAQVVDANHRIVCRLNGAGYGEKLWVDDLAEVLCAAVNAEAHKRCVPCGGAA